MRLFAGLLAVNFALVAAMSRADESPMVPWLTRSADNARSGWNQHEKSLTPGSITAAGLVRAQTVAVPGDARGLEAQPLIVPGLSVADGTTHDVMILASMANVVRAVDAHTGARLWSVTLGTPINGNTPIGPVKPAPDECVGSYPTIDCHQVNDKWGILSTGVIDADTQRLYVVAWVSPDGTPQKANHYVFVLKLADGSPVVPPVLVAGTSGAQSYSTTLRRQRSSLLMTEMTGTKTVFFATGNVLESSNASGWIFAFDCATNTLSASLAMSQGQGSAIWMGGQGLSADAEGSLYAVTGNGEFDGRSQWGESFVKIKYTPAWRQAAATLTVVDHWTPWTDLARSGRTKASSASASGAVASSDAVRPIRDDVNVSLKGARSVKRTNDLGAHVTLVYPKTDPASGWDADLGSAGPACIFSVGVCIAAGKDGIGYPIRTHNAGGTTPADLADPARNCAKLAGPPVWMTTNPGAVPACPKDPRTLNFLPSGHTAHLHMTPVQFYDPLLKSWTLFAWGENSPLRKWAVSSTGQLTYVAQGHERASASGTSSGGAPGGFCSGSSYGRDPTSTAILVCAVPAADAASGVVKGRLLIYDPLHLAADGSLAVLWDSERHGLEFTFNKFNPPLIDGGQIFVPNYNGGVDIYRLGGNTPH